MRVEDLRVDENVVVVLSSKACIGIIFGSSSNPDSTEIFFVHSPSTHLLYHSTILSSYRYSLQCNALSLLSFSFHYSRL